MNEEQIQQAAEALRAGGVVIYPTDTVYGLGADATNAKAVSLVRRIKGREPDAPILAMVRDIAMLEEYALVTSLARKLARAYIPGPLSPVLQVKDDRLAPVSTASGTVGFRIPDHSVCRALAQEVSFPITSTSVNKSGMPQARSVPAMRAQLDDMATHIAACIDCGELPQSSPSTVVDAATEHVRVLREGAISREELHRVL